MKLYMIRVEQTPLQGLQRDNGSWSKIKNYTRKTLIQQQLLEKYNHDDVDKQSYDLKSEYEG